MGKPIILLFQWIGMREKQLQKVYIPKRAFSRFSHKTILGLMAVGNSIQV